MQLNKKQLPFAVLALALLLGGCASGPESLSPDAISTQAEVGTNGKLIPIQSSNVRAAGYDAALEIMTVQFGNGAVYEYYQVPLDLWEEFVAAQPHPWSQVGIPRLVQAGIPYKRIG